MDTNVTRDVIMAATGRALDALVAEAFGWTEIEARVHVEGIQYIGRHPEKQWTAMMPTYSAGWPGIGLVVDRMRADGWGITLEFIDQWECVFEKWSDITNNWEFQSYVRHESASVACSQAALLAKLAESETKS